jgi:hypothetical protein
MESKTLSTKTYSILRTFSLIKMELETTGAKDTLLLRAERRRYST